MIKITVIKITVIKGYSEKDYGDKDFYMLNFSARESDSKCFIINFMHFNTKQWGIRAITVINQARHDTSFLLEKRNIVTAIRCDYGDKSARHHNTSSLNKRQNIMSLEH